MINVHEQPQSTFSIFQFQQATTNTPLGYLQRVRMEAAKKILETKNEGIVQVAARCGKAGSSTPDIQRNAPRHRRPTRRTWPTLTTF